MPRVLLLLPTTTYRATDFLEAATRNGIDVVAASDKSNVMAEKHPDQLLTLDFRKPAECAKQVLKFHARSPIDAVLPVDDETAVVAAAIGSALRLKHNSVASAKSARDKDLLMTLLDRNGIRVPASIAFGIDTAPESIAPQVEYPCILKPVCLSGSRGVIRANDEIRFLQAWERIQRILSDPKIRSKGPDLAGKILVQDYIQGPEVAIEAILTAGKLQILAIFDKPDPMEGPFFEETLYVTPSRHPPEVIDTLMECISSATLAIGLQQGPVHAELRFNEAGAWMIDLAARSIGGLCSRTLRFGTGLSLEDLILRNALGRDMSGLQRETTAAGVMMIPIKRGGILRGIRGLDAAQKLPLIQNVTITARLDNPIVPLPEGSSYLGFIFARGPQAADVEDAMRNAFARLAFEVEPD